MAWVTPREMTRVRQQFHALHALPLRVLEMKLDHHHSHQNLTLLPSHVIVTRGKICEWKLAAHSKSRTRGTME